MVTYAEGSHENFISVAEGMSGWWFTVMYWWNPEMNGFWEPYITGNGRYPTKEKAIEKGIEWAEFAGLEFVMPG